MIDNYEDDQLFTFTYTEKLVSEIVKAEEDNIVHLIIKAANNLNDGVTIKYDIDLERAKRALIKEFCPARILTMEELRSIHEPTLVWVQDVDKGIPVRPEEFHGIGKAPYSNEESVEYESVEYADGFDYAGDYGRIFIFWTGKPTEEQQAKVVWAKEREEDRE